MPTAGEEADIKQEEVVNKGHKLDSINLLIFVGLLILVVVTIWMFKHRRLRFVHETGLAIIYGLIIGAVITYSSPANEITSENVTLPINSSFNAYNYPNAVKLFIPVVNHTEPKIYQYSHPEEQSQAQQQEKILEEKATFDPEVFFNVLLPPIIFNAGYSMKRKHFFKNFGAIITYAFLGTTISCAAVGAITYGVMLLKPSMEMGATDCLLFGALISATDPVTILAIFSDLNADVDLYALVFGESVLNDAVAIVLSESIEHYQSSKEGFDGFAVLKAVGNFAKVFFGAFALGSAMGCGTAIVSLMFSTSDVQYWLLICDLTKFTAIREHPLLETSLFFLMSYGTFLAAEAADLTGKYFLHLVFTSVHRSWLGIVAVLFCGICQAHYTYNNLSEESKARTKELGIIIGRALNVYPLSFLLNLGRSNKIHYNFQHMMMFSGLRGAIAFALAIRNTQSDQRKVIFSTTLVLVITTVILFGGFTTQMLQWLKIRVGVEDDTELQNFQAVRQSPTDNGPSVEPIPGRLAEKARLVRIWYNIDSKYVKPFLTNAKPPLTETLPKCCRCIGRIFTTERQLSQTDGVRRPHDEGSDLDFIIDDQDPSYGDTSTISAAEGATAAKVNGSSTQEASTRPTDRAPIGRNYTDDLDHDLLTSDTSPLLEYNGYPPEGSAVRSLSIESELLEA
ncbi:hypothetical protein LSH36_136g04037 [Paralvinella palmiformis]|uniref:Cation/H+ exchanger transmembrane domain-containing protein n=1 Tax=Paralvinella palmiformis TaxID=53620 RepID=A0AAD9JWT8_9ANNE|nr:hypothetical protein LSH36_136g04037 [Paralvinella palmiformis]